MGVKLECPDGAVTVKVDVKEASLGREEDPRTPLDPRWIASCSNCSMTAVRVFFVISPQPLNRSVLADSDEHGEIDNLPIVARRNVTLRTGATLRVRLP